MVEMNQEWIEFSDIKKRDFSRSSWIPLRSVTSFLNEGKYGFEGHKEEIFYCTSIAFQADLIEKASKLNWSEMGLSSRHHAYVEKNKYYPAEGYDSYRDEELKGIHLVLEQQINSLDGTIWHLNQDLVFALNLIKEGDTWLSPNDGYEEVARLKKTSNGKPLLLEIRATYLKDYLCARGMSLVLCSYRSRRRIERNKELINWKSNTTEDSNDSYLWKGRVSEIHEGGNSFGSSMAVFHVARTDVDPEEDVPVLKHPTESEFESKSFTKKFNGEKLFVISGELWRTEVIERGTVSLRVREDENNEMISFIIEASGEKESITNLEDSGRWLWFKPEVMMALAHRRGGNLSWYTAETGRISSSADSSGLHFGINKIGLVNVYAKDLCYLYPWEQTIWASYNITPDGGVSKELQDSHVRATPAETLAPEPYLKSGLEELNQISQNKFGFKIIRDHEDFEAILNKTHRFRSIDKNGLYSLAKDIARLTADSINTVEVQKLLTLNKGEKLGSLKSLERLVALKSDNKTARETLSALVGAYELRHGDAHLPGSEIEEYFKLVKIDKNTPYVHQGFSMLSECVSSIHTINYLLKR